MPMRDASPWLAQCIASIREQTFEDYELIVVDDGCVDDGPAQVRARAGADKRVRLLRSPGKGLVAALNHGIASARAPLVARMDADDCMHPSRIEVQLRALCACPRLALVGCQVEAFPGATLGAGMREYMRWQNGCMSEEQVARQIYVESPFTHPSVMFRRAVVIASGGYRDGDFPEDYELWLRLARAGHAMAKAPGVLLRWRQRPGSLSRTDPRYARVAFDALRARYLAVDPRLDSTRPLVAWGAGRRTRQRSRWLRDAGREFSAWVDIDPRKIGNRVDGLPVQPVAWLADQRARSPRPFVLGYVASHGARDSMSMALTDMGYREDDDFLMVG